MELVQYSVKDKIGTIAMNRPEKRNAMSPELIAALSETFREASADPEVKVVVLKGRGESFCAGADLAYLQRMQKFSYEENLQDSLQLKELFWQIYTLEKVVIAQVQGHALAGGCGLATVCDFCFAVEDAKFGYTEVKIGFVPALVMVFLLSKIGEARARHWLLTGTLISAKEAYTAGLVSCVSEQRWIETDVQKFASQLISSGSSHAVMLTKKMISHVQSSWMLQALEEAAALNAKARGTDDCKRGISAFLEKKKINWY